MSDLDPDVRDRAAQAAEASMSEWGDHYDDVDRRMTLEVVDAVAEVLAAEREALVDRVITLEAQRAGLLERCRQADRSKSLPELSTGEIRRALGIPLLGGSDD